VNPKQAQYYYVFEKEDYVVKEFKKTEKLFIFEVVPKYFVI